MNKTNTKEDLLQKAKLERQIDEPPLFKVILHNDDYTTMEFVVQVLIEIFRKSVEEATDIMLRVHNENLGVCGIYAKEIAETKVEIVHAKANASGFPLLASYEKA